MPRYESLVGDATFANLPVKLPTTHTHTHNLHTSVYIWIYTYIIFATRQNLRLAPAGLYILLIDLQSNSWIISSFIIHSLHSYAVSL